MTNWSRGRGGRREVAINFHVSHFETVVLSGPGKSFYLTELLDFFLKSHCILVLSKRRGKMSLISTRSPCARLFIIEIYSSVRAVLSHPDCLLSTCYYIRLD